MTPARRRLVGRGLGLVVLYAVVLVGAVQLRWEPDPLRLALVVGLLALSLTLGFRLLEPSGRSGWRVDAVSVVGQPGRDARLGLYLRIIEGHLTSATPDASLRDRLAMLIDRTLEQRHGLRLEDPRAGVLLGPELTEVLEGPPRRLSPAQLSELVGRIEDL